MGSSPSRIFTEKYSINSGKVTHLKTKEEIAIMREGGKILARILSSLRKLVKPGVTTASIEKAAKELMASSGVHPSFLGFNGFPAAICISINEEIVHGLPSDRIIKEGDLVKLDVGVLHKGFHTDSALTCLAATEPKKWPDRQKLVQVTEEALQKGIKMARPGKTLGDLGAAIQDHIEKNGYGVIRELIGHGIGRNLHEPPEVLNYGDPGTGEILKEGMVLAIEPLTAIGTWKVKLGRNGMVYETKDKSLSAHAEHTVAITSKGPLILTQ